MTIAAICDVKLKSGNLNRRRPWGKVSVGNIAGFRQLPWLKHPYHRSYRRYKSRSVLVKRLHSYLQEIAVAVFSREHGITGGGMRVLRVVVIGEDVYKLPWDRIQREYSQQDKR